MCSDATHHFPIDHARCTEAAEEHSRAQDACVKTGVEGVEGELCANKGCALEEKDKRDVDQTRGLGLPHSAR